MTDGVRFASGGVGAICVSTVATWRSGTHEPSVDVALPDRVAVIAAYSEICYSWRGSTGAGQRSARR